MLGLVYEVDGKLSSPKTRIAELNFAKKVRRREYRVRKIKRFFTIWK